MFGLQNVHFFEDEDENGLLPVISSTNKTTSNDDDDDWEKVILSDQVQLELDDKDDDDPDESSNEFSTQNLISDDFVRLNYKEALSTLIELQLSTTNDLSASAKEDVPESLSFDNPKESRPEVKPDTIRTNEVEDDPSKSETLSTQSINDWIEQSVEEEDEDEPIIEFVESIEPIESNQIQIQSDHDSIVEAFPIDLNYSPSKSILNQDFSSNLPIKLNSNVETSKSNVGIEFDDKFWKRFESQIGARLLSAFRQEMHECLHDIDHSLKQNLVSNQEKEKQSIRMLQENVAKTIELKQQIEAIRSQMQNLTSNQKPYVEVDQIAIDDYRRREIEWKNELNRQFHDLKLELEHQIANQKPPDLIRQIRDELEKLKLNNPDNGVANVINSIQDILQQNQKDLHFLLNYVHNEREHQLNEQSSRTETIDGPLQHSMKNLIDLNAQSNERLQRLNQSIELHNNRMVSIEINLDAILQKVTKLSILGESKEKEKEFIDQHTQCEPIELTVDCVSSNLLHESKAIKKESDPSLLCMETDSDAITSELRKIWRQSQNALKTYRNNIRNVQSTFRLADEATVTLTSIHNLSNFDKSILNHRNSKSESAQFDETLLPFQNDSSGNSDAELHQLARLQRIRKLVNRKMIRLDRTLCIDRSSAK